MAGMAGALILDLKRHGRKGRSQFLLHGGCDAHDLNISAGG
jgi:hypothetical protein